MKLLKIIIACLMVAMCASSSSAKEHPAEVAERKLELARKKFQAAEKRLNEAVALIDDAQRKAEATKAIEMMKKSLDGIITADSRLSVVVSSAPDTSTPASLLPFWAEIKHLKFFTSLYLEHAEYIELTWKTEDK